MAIGERWIQLGLYDPLDEGRPVRMIGRPMPKTAWTLKLFHSVLAEYSFSREHRMVLSCFEVSASRFSESAVEFFAAVDAQGYTGGYS